MRRTAERYLPLVIMLRKGPRSPLWEALWRRLLEEDPQTGPAGHDSVDGEANATPGTGPSEPLSAVMTKTHKSSFTSNCPGWRLMAAPGSAKGKPGPPKKGGSAP